MNNIDLSIIIPQYKEDEKKIGDLLHSIDIQSKVDWSKVEVIIVNDHSDVILSKEFLNRFNNIHPRYFRLEKNSGPGVARQAGLNRAKGKWIMFCDSDDILFNVLAIREVLLQIESITMSKLPTKLIQFTWYSEELEDSATGTDYAIYDRDKDWLHGKIFKKSYIDKYDIHFSPNIKTLGEDSFFLSLFFFRLRKQEDKYIKYSDVSIYLWRKWGTSLTGGLCTVSACATGLREYYRSRLEIYDYYLSHNLISEKDLPRVVSEAMQVGGDTVYKFAANLSNAGLITTPEYFAYRDNIYEYGREFFKAYGKYINLANVHTYAVELETKYKETYKEGSFDANLAEIIDEYARGAVEYVKRNGFSES